MNGKPDYFPRLVPMVLAIFLVWPPSVLVQEKKPSSAAQLPDEKKPTPDDPLDDFFAERHAKKEALARAACQNLTVLREMSKRIEKQDPLTDQDRSVIQDGPRFDEDMNKLALCANELSGDERDEYLMVAANVRGERIEYLERHVRGLAAKYNELAVNYNDLAARYNDLLDKAKYVILTENKATSSRFPWLNSPLFMPTSPIRGPVVCKGSTIALGQGMTSIYVNCH